MVLSLLYRETQTLETLSNSFSGLLKKPKLVVSALPAIVGLLPVPGGALMSAPLVEAEADKLGLDKPKKTYVNVWFRHVIFPVYPMSQFLLLAAALTGASITSIIVSQIPVVAAMVAVGYFMVLRKPKIPANAIQTTKLRDNLRDFLISFLPIIVMILTVMIFNVDVAAAAFVGIALLLCITRPSWQILVKVFSNPAVYLIALAAFGAMSLRGIMVASGVTETIGQAMAAWSVNEVLLLATLPAVLALLVSSPSGGIALSTPILAGTLNFTASSASLLYISAYFGYLAAPTHLCLVLTADYFKCPLSKLYRILVPSLIVSFVAALVVYFV
jgi:integral membrane protein (TIGR00529 family)